MTSKSGFVTGLILLGLLVLGVGTETRLGGNTLTSVGSQTLKFRVPPKISFGKRALAIRKGEALFEDSSPIAGNRLSCASCHLDDGTDANVLPLVGVASAFPRMSQRYHARLNLSQRINWCVMNSLAGKWLEPGNPELNDLTRYLDWISVGYPKNVPLPWLKRPVLVSDKRYFHSGRGEELYRSDCAYCHGPKGQGSTHGFLAPPLWGPDSYTRHASLDRQAMLAAFIQKAMPAVAMHGIRPGGLSVPDTQSLAAFILRHNRPAG